VKLVKGWAAYSESRFDQSLAIADQMLATAPFDPSATVLKARALVGLNRDDEALDLLTRQVQSQPADTGILALLVRIYQRRSDWAKVTDFAARLSDLAPQDQQNMLILTQAALRSGNIPLARATSSKLLQPKADPTLVSKVLDQWADYWPSPQRLEDARRLAAGAGTEQRLVYAAFLSRVGSPADAARLVGDTASLPVKASNAEANAVLGDALLRGGNIAAAKSRLDAVLAFDPGNSTALRARSELEIRVGQAKTAVEDAQKLVTVLPTSARDRLVLARAFTAAGNRAWTERTLWAAFQEIPADEHIYAALRSTKNGNTEAMNELQAEFERQRAARLNRGLL
jgi:predicted Zn-dependent protease